MNLAWAIVPSICIGVNSLLVVKARGQIYQQVLWVAAGALTAAGIMVFFFPVSYTLPHFLLCVLCGAMCAMGNVCLYRGFQYVGVAYSMALTTGLQLIGVSSLGVILFGEWATSLSKIWGVSALAALIAGTSLAVYREPAPHVKESEMFSTKRRLTGTLWVLLASVCYTLYPVILQAGGVSGFAVGLPVMVGLFLGALCFSIIRMVMTGKGVRSWGTPRWWLLGLAGLIWGLGVNVMLVCNQVLGVATSFPLSQLGVIISVLGGVYILKEQRTRREMVGVYIGLVLLIVGAVCIGAAKGADTAALGLASTFA